MADSLIQDILNKHPDASRDALIPILQEVQDAEGYLSKDTMMQIGKALNLPVSKIYGVATFYNQFRFSPVGKYHIQICRGTACHVKGSSKILSALTHELNVEPGETTRDGLFSLEVVACIGACGLAPVISINGEFFADMSPEKVRKLIEQHRKEKDIHETVAA